MSTIQQIKRRQNALSRLEIQLAKGKKKYKGEVVELSDDDIKRINKEIGTIKAKI